MIVLVEQSASTSSLTASLAVDVSFVQQDACMSCLLSLTLIHVTTSAKFFVVKPRFA